MLISNCSLMIQIPIRVLRANNDINCSLNIPFGFPRVVIERHRLTYGGNVAQIRDKMVNR